MSSIFALLLTLIIVGSCFYTKSRRDKENIYIMMQAGLAYFEKGDMENINPNLDLNNQADLLPYDRRFEFSKEKLKLKERLGSGCFGVVYKAIAVDILPREPETTVAVKTISKQPDAEMIKTLTKELKIMIHLGRHLNIVNLLGAVTRNIAKREMMMICEYCCYGNILDFLQSHRSTFKNLIQNGKLEKLQAPSKNVWNHQSTAVSYKTVTQQSSGYVQVPAMTSNKPIENLQVIVKGSMVAVDTLDLISWSFQISRGMDYLASKKIIHGDLAARNVLLCEGNVVKICDFGLAKALYKSYVYKRSKDAKLPFKWLAVECVTDQIFSVWSDIWAYGEKLI